MSKKKVMFALAGFSLGVALAIPAEAKSNKPGKKKDCPGNWDRVKVEKADCEKEARRVDRDGNDDDLVCEKRRYGVIKYRDND
jgi:hypothetical protein